MSTKVEKEFNMEEYVKEAAEVMMGPLRYSRPIHQIRPFVTIVEAIQLHPLNIEAVEAFVSGDLGKNEKGETVIATQDGAMVCKMGDYIIKGVNGEFYPCDSGIFKKNYKEVAE